MNADRCLNIAIALLLCAVLLHTEIKCSGKKKENRDGAPSVEYVEKTKIIRDTVTVTEITARPQSRSAYKSQADRALLGEAGVTAREVKFDAALCAAATDTVRAVAVGDTVFSYHDHFADISFNTADTSFIYSVRDSLQITVSKRRKHRFLFIRWGEWQYRVHVINFNPHSTLTGISTTVVD